MSNWRLKFLSLIFPSIWSLLLAIFCLCQPAEAHEVRPAYLELRQTGLETYDVLWKVPGRGENLRLGLYVELPAGSTNVTEPRASMINNAFTERWTVTRPGGLTGGTIHIAGLSSTMTDVLVRLERLDGTTLVTRLTPSAPSYVVEAAPRATQVAATYLKLGVEHILLGIDHLLFVLGLILIVRGTWLLVKTITAFTVAHSITLGLATLGFVHVPQAPVEAVIALSIVFVASELARQRSGQPDVMARYPWIVAFVFGLLHGFGFAGALAAVGLPQTDIPLALLFFNVGVELGQLSFVGSVAGAIWAFHHVVGATPLWLPRAAAYGIGSVSSFWVIQRVVAF